VTDVGAGAGAQSRAADAHLILRQHVDDGAYVAEWVARSWAPGKPICLRWDYPIWRLAPDLDPADLRPDRPKRERKPAADAPPAELPWTAERFAAEFGKSEPQHGDAFLEAAALAGLSDRKAGQLFKRAIATGKLHQWQSPDDKRLKLYATEKQPETVKEEPAESAV
jgi:hypothetical protein